MITWIGLGIWLYTAVLILGGSYQADFFDAALATLSQRYSQMGLVPYRDFGMVYPPGLFVLFGQIFQAETLAQTQWLAGGMYLLTQIICYRVAKKLDLLDQTVVSAYAYLQAVELRMMGFKGSLPFSILLVAVLVWLDKVRSPKRSWAVFLPMFLLPWIRWEWAMMGVLGLILIGWREKRAREAAGWGLAGLLMGGATLWLYLKRLAVMELAYEYMVRMPLWLTATYRDLPLPFSLNPRASEMALYPLLFFAGWNLFRLWKKDGWTIRMWVGTGLTFATLPYALGRTDLGHLLPLWLAAITVLALHGKSDLLGKWILVLVVLPTLPWFLERSNWMIPQWGAAERIIQAETASCLQATEHLEAKSIWIGRRSYDQYLFNIVTLYLTRPELPPATRFIAEEPGIQSGCEYGEEVAAELESAPKPVLMYLALDEHQPENRYTREMKSCGKIEEYLERKDVVTQGHCESYGHLFEVAILK